MKVLATNIGKRKTMQWQGKTIETGIFKQPTLTPIFLGEEDVVDDAVVDRKHHGGIDQAVYAYGKNHYAYWQKRYPNLTWHLGMFGENLTLDHLDETILHVGDTFKIGTAIIAVTKPRKPCRVLGMRFNNTNIIKQFFNTTKSGVYFKVLQTGNVQAGDTMALLKSNKSNPTIAAVFKK